MNDGKNTLKRALRTFVQAALGYLVAAVGGGIAGLFDAEGRISKVAVGGLVVSSVAAGLAALMNLPKSEKSAQAAEIDERYNEEYYASLEKIIDEERSRKGE